MGRFGAHSRWALMLVKGGRSAGRARPRLERLPWKQREGGKVKGGGRVCLCVQHCCSLGRECGGYT